MAPFLQASREVNRATSGKGLPGAPCGSMILSTEPPSAKSPARFRWTRLLAVTVHRPRVLPPLRRPRPPFAPARRRASAEGRSVPCVPRVAATALRPTPCRATRQGPAIRTLRGPPPLPSESAQTVRERVWAPSPSNGRNRPAPAAARSLPYSLSIHSSLEKETFSREPLRGRRLAVSLQMAGHPDSRAHVRPASCGLTTGVQQSHAFPLTRWRLVLLLALPRKRVPSSRARRRATPFPRADRRPPVLRPFLPCDPPTRGLRPLRGPAPPSPGRTGGRTPCRREAGLRFSRRGPTSAFPPHNAHPAATRHPTRGFASRGPYHSEGCTQPRGSIPFSRNRARRRTSSFLLPPSAPRRSSSVSRAGISSLRPLRRLYPQGGTRRQARPADNKKAARENRRPYTTPSRNTILLPIQPLLHSPIEIDKGRAVQLHITMGPADRGLHEDTQVRVTAGLREGAHLLGHDLEAGGLEQGR